MMKEEHLFPVDLTEEERGAGFHLVETRLSIVDRETFGGHTSTVVAVRPLAPGVRLIKMRDMMALPGESNIGYHLQVFGVDAALADKPWNKAKWEIAGSGFSKTIQGALARYHRDGIPSDIKRGEPPEESTVPQWPIPDAR